MKSANFQPADPTSILSFLHNFELGCDFGGVHEGVDMLHFQQFMKDSGKAALPHRVSAMKEDFPEPQRI